MFSYLNFYSAKTKSVQHLHTTQHPEANWLTFVPFDAVDTKLNVICANFAPT